MGGWPRAGAVLAGLVLPSVMMLPGGPRLTWSLVPSPTKATGDVLNGVSCARPARCMTVGLYLMPDGTARTLAESWNGTRWSVVPTPSPRPVDDVLESVSCASVTVCTAVGAHLTVDGNPSGTLAESWNGARWSAVPSPSPGSGSILDGLSCISVNACMAVGYFVIRSGHTRTLAESWNGARWSVVPSPGPAAASTPALSAVSCASATACMATGNFFIHHDIGKTLIESWNGHRWSVVPSPSRGSDSYLESLSCPSAAVCMATGSYTRGGPDGPQWTLAESWNGHRWSVVPAPGGRGSDNDLDSVSCLSPAACTAVGISIGGQRASTLIESWNGHRWSVVPSPNRNNFSYLLGVSCPAAIACTATGYYYFNRPGLPHKTLIESGTASS